MSDEINENVDVALEELFSKSKSVEDLVVTLPSKGKGYKTTKQNITLRPMTYDDEKFLAQNNTDNLVDLMLSRCVDNIDIDELYLEDKLFLYYKLRECSFGSQAKVTTDCTFCDTINTLEIDLSMLNVDYADDDFCDPQEFILPILQQPILLKKIRSYNFEYTNDPDILLNNLWRFIEKLGEYEDSVIIAKAIKKLSSADVRFILTNIKTNSFGLDTRAKYLCSNCNKENIAQVGLSFDFFMMS
jgi:hypothetical protein